MSSTPWSSSHFGNTRNAVRVDQRTTDEPRRASRIAVACAALVLLALVTAGSVALGALIEASVKLFAPS